MNERRKHTAQIKFHIALQVLSHQKSAQAIAREYGINVNLIAKWKKTLEENGAIIFESKIPKNDSESKVKELENIIGKKEIELQLLKKYLGFYTQGWQK